MKERILWCREKTNCNDHMTAYEKESLTTIQKPGKTLCVEELNISVSKEPLEELICHDREFYFLKNNKS